MTTTQNTSPIVDSFLQDLPVAGAQVELDRLVRVFGQTRALDGFSLTIERGEFVALLGPSGCGKTTALRVLAGFERLDSGRVVVNGQDLARVSAQNRDMGMVFQSYSLFPNMNALNNVAYGLRMRKQRSRQRRKKAGELLELVGLADQASKYPHQMSGGQQQRVALARALAIEPRVLLLDEPLSALDAKVRAELRDQIRSLQQRLAITTVFVTHDQEEALSMADRVCVMKSGHIEQTATPATLYLASGDRRSSPSSSASRAGSLSSEAATMSSSSPSDARFATVQGPRPGTAWTPCCGPRTSPSRSTRTGRDS